MANRRMFAHDVLTTDRFQSMSRDAQFLYIHLGMHADDDGFLGSPMLLARMIACTQESLAELVKNGYIIEFPSGVCVITHWRLNNYIQRDRYKETIYQEEKSHLGIGESGAYFYTETPCIHSVYSVDTQVSLEQDKINQVNKELELELGYREEEEEKEEKAETILLGEHKNVILTNEEYEELKQKFPDTHQDMIENLSRKLHKHHYTFQNHYITLLTWNKQDSARGITYKKNPEPMKEQKKEPYDFAAIERKAFLNVTQDMCEREKPPE